MWASYVILRGGVETDRRIPRDYSTVARMLLDRGADVNARDHSGRTAQGFQEELKGLGQDVNRIRDDVSALAEGTVDVARSAAGEVQRRAIQAAQTAKRQGLAAREHLKEAVVKRPFASLAIAFGIGLAGGMLLARRRD